MPRIANITNFQGQIIASQNWVLQQIEDITSGTNSVFVNNSCDTQYLVSYMASLNGSTGNVVIIKAGTAKGSYIFTDANGHYQKIVIDNETQQAILGLSSRISTVQTDLSQIMLKTVVGNETTYKIKPSVIPDIAITDIYTINASGQGNTQKTLNELIISAVGQNKIQKGDVIIVTAETQERALQVAGNYIFVSNIDNSANITSADYVKLYSGSGSVVSVNNVAPISGNVQLSIIDLDDVALTYVSGTQVVDQILLFGISVAKKSDMTFIGEQVSLIQQQQNNNIVAIEKAVQLVETTVTVNQTGSAQGVTVTVTVIYDTDNVTVTNRTVSVVTTGRVLQVWDSNGNVIIPDITYLSNSTTLTARYGTRQLDSTWTILRSVPISVQMAQVSSESSN